MQTITEHLSFIVEQAVRAYAWEAVGTDSIPAVVPNKVPDRGDFQWNGAFQLAKALGKAPREVALDVAHRIQSPMIAKAEAVGAFVNLRLDDEWLGTQTLAVAMHPRLGTPQATNSLVIVDYSSPNIAKRMHVGHLRSTVIGAAIDRLHRFLGHQVIADNHIGDWGTPFGKLLVAIDRWGPPDLFTGPDPVGALQGLYTRFEEEVEKDNTLMDAARAAVVRLQNGDADVLATWQRAVDTSMREFQAVYDRLGVLFDMTRGESQYADRLGSIVQIARDAQIAVESDGAVVVPLEGFPAPLLIQKRDGAYLYATTDLATIHFRLGIDIGADRIVYVTDKRQHDHFAQVFAAARKMWPDIRPETLVHIGFGMLRLPSDEVMATRGGNAVPLVMLLDEAVRRARLVVDAKNPELPSEARAAIAEAVGVSSVVYADLSRDPASDVMFEWDRMLALDGNTASYLMYALARCHGILRQAQADTTPTGAVVPVVDPTERALALAICRTPDVLKAACDTYRPDMLAAHLYDIAGALAKFHGTCRVIVDGRADPGRLDLVRATALTLSQGFEILGLRSLPRI